MENKLARRLLEHWKGSGAKAQEPASLEAIRRFETKYSTVIPVEFREYLDIANGFDQSRNHQDHEGFNFWPLEDIIPVPRWGDGEIDFPEAHCYFIFCDYLDFSWAYALRLGHRNKGDVVMIGTRNGRPQKVASSFQVFLGLYLDGDAELYPS